MVERLARREEARQEEVRLLEASFTHGRLTLYPNPVKFLRMSFLQTLTV
jgi:hypothetical protein